MVNKLYEFQTEAVVLPVYCNGISIEAQKTFNRYFPNAFSLFTKDVAEQNLNIGQVAIYKDTKKLVIVLPTKGHHSETVNKSKVLLGLESFLKEYQNGYIKAKTVLFPNFTTDPPKNNSQDKPLANIDRYMRTMFEPIKKNIIIFYINKDNKIERLYENTNY